MIVMIIIIMVLLLLEHCLQRQINSTLQSMSLGFVKVLIKVENGNTDNNK